MMNTYDWDEYYNRVEELKRVGWTETLAKIIAYEKVKEKTKEVTSKEVFSPYETINS